MQNMSMQQAAMMQRLAVHQRAQQQQYAQQMAQFAFMKQQQSGNRVQMLQQQHGYTRHISLNGGAPTAPIVNRNNHEVKEEAIHNQVDSIQTPSVHPDRTISLPDDVFDNIKTDIEHTRNTEFENFNIDDTRSSLSDILKQNHESTENAAVAAATAKALAKLQQGIKNEDQGAKKSRPNHSLIEKRRRDKMKAHITELASLVPMCSAVASNKLDKFTVLRLAKQYIKSLAGSSTGPTKSLNAPSFVSDDELRKISLNIANGFLLIVDCTQTKVVFASESVKKYLRISSKDLTGRSALEIFSNADDIKAFKNLIKPGNSSASPIGSARSMIARVKKPLPGPKLSDLKTEENEQPQPPKKKVKKQNFEEEFFKADLVPPMEFNSLTNSDAYNMTINGYIKTVTNLNAFLGKTDNFEKTSVEKETPCFICVVNPVKSTSSVKRLSTRNLNFSFKLNLDGKFISASDDITHALGYVSQDILKSSVYDLIHKDDIAKVSKAHETILESSETKILTKKYRLRTKKRGYVPVRTKMHCFKNPFTGQPQYIMCSTNIEINPEVKKPAKIVVKKPLIKKRSSASSSVSSNSEKSHKIDVDSTAVFDKLNADALSNGTLPNLLPHHISAPCDLSWTSSIDNDLLMNLVKTEPGISNTKALDDILLGINKPSVYRTKSLGSDSEDSGNCGHKNELAVIEKRLQKLNNGKKLEGVGSENTIEMLLGVLEGS